MIYEFKNDFRWLSNFSPIKIILDEITYPSVEHAYHSAKSNDMEWKNFCSENHSAVDVKKRSKTIIVRHDWDNIKLNVMYHCLLQKFNQEPYKTQLLSTGDENIIEGNTYGDEFFGVNLNSQPNCGENFLGRQIMKIRDDLRENISNKDITITLTNGTEVWVEKFLFKKTYSGFLEGNPGWLENFLVVDKECPKEWGKIKTLVLIPPEKMRGWLSPATYEAMITCDEPLDKAFDGSSLVVVWVDEMPGNRSMKTIVEAAIKDIDWQKHAEDWSF